MKPRLETENYQKIIKIILRFANQFTSTGDGTQKLDLNNFSFGPKGDDLLIRTANFPAIDPQFFQLFFMLFNQGLEHEISQLIAYDPTLQATVIHTDKLNELLMKIKFENLENPQHPNAEPVLNYLRSLITLKNIKDAQNELIKQQYQIWQQQDINNLSTWRVPYLKAEKQRQRIAQRTFTMYNKGYYVESVRDRKERSAKLASKKRR